MQTAPHRICRGVVRLRLRPSHAVPNFVALFWH